jgi:hypothetical protein
MSSGMRGNKRPAVRPTTNEAQSVFRTLSRHRRAKLARQAHTTLVKADQWSRGDMSAPEIVSSLEHAMEGHSAKGAKKKG